MGRGARRICTDQGWATHQPRGADTVLSRAARFLQGTARLALRWTIPANGLRQDSKIRASRDVSPAASDTALASALSAVPIRWPKSKGPHWGRGRRRYHRLRRSAVGLGRAKTRGRCIDAVDRPGRFCNGRRTDVGGSYALIAAISGLLPMMFMTRVIL